MTIYPGVQNGVAFVGGEPVPYVDSGAWKDSDRVVLLVHGSGGSAQAHFGALFPMLANRRRVVALDYGCGELCSAKGLTLQHLVDKVSAVLDDLPGVGAVDLVGYSLGAAVATVFAQSQPDRVHTLSFLGGWLTTDHHQHLRQDIWEGLSLAAPELLPLLSAFTTLSPSYHASLPPAGRDALREQRPGGGDRQRQVALLRELDIVQAATQVLAPTLVVAGRHDLMAPLHHARAVLGAIPDSRLAVVGAGHAMLLERPAEIYQLIDAFMREPQRHSAGSHLPAVVV